MKSKDTISKGPKRHDPTCYQVQEDVVIPKGTILRAAGDNKFAAQIGLVGEFSITIAPDVLCSRYKRVIA